MMTFQLRVVFLVLRLTSVSTQPYYGCRQCDIDYYCNSSDKQSACCLGANISYHLPFEAVDKPRYSCISTIFITETEKTRYLIPKDAATFIKNAWMIAQCSPSWNNDIIRNRCEFQDKNDDIQLHIPVSHLNYHYRNKYCATCNGVDNDSYRPWITEIYCDADLSSAINILSSVKRRKCNIFLRPHNDSIISSCLNTYYNTSSDCKLTASLSKTLESRNAICEKEENSPKHSHETEYFCYTCASTSELLLNQKFCTISPSGVTDLFPSFTAILDIDAVQMNQENQNTCDQGTQVFDATMNTCRDLYCDEARYLSLGRCISSKEKEKSETCSIQYFFIKLSQASSLKYITSVMLYEESFKENLERIINNVTREVQALHLRVFTKSSTIMGLRTIDFWILQIVINSTSFDGDYLSFLYTDIHGSNFELFPNILFTAKLVMYDLKRNESFSQASILHIPAEMKAETLELNYVYFRHQTFLPSDYTFCLEPIYKLLLCPFLEIQLSGITMDIINLQNGFLTIKGKLSTIVLNNWDFKRTEDGIVICLDDFIKANGDSEMSLLTSALNNQPQTIHPKQILAFICVCFSIGSLLVTVGTYLTFHKLQSQPGINNVILCISLLLAQTFYQFGAGQTTLPKWSCALIGAFCHFFWLTVMFSMNICSVEMYFVFRKLAKLTPRFRWLHTLRNVIYVVSSSALFVIINLVISLVQSQGKESGYGGSLCYLSSPVMQVFVFVLPSAITVLANIICFSLVVLKIRRSCIDPASLNQERNYLAVYARLSSIVGLTWIFGFLQLLLNNEVIEYIFIVLNASQGVSVMIAFVVNKRTLSLYCEKKHDSSNANPSKVAAHNFKTSIVVLEDE